jgi:hypothetical protein
MMPADPKDRAKVVKAAKADGWCFHCENPVTVSQYERSHKDGRCQNRRVTKSSAARVAGAGEISADRIGSVLKHAAGIETDLQVHERLAKSVNGHDGAELKAYHEDAARKLREKGKR